MTPDHIKRFSSAYLRLPVAFARVVESRLGLSDGTLTTSYDSETAAKIERAIFKSSASPATKRKLLEKIFQVRRLYRLKQST